MSIAPGGQIDEHHRHPAAQEGQPHRPGSPAVTRAARPPCAPAAATTRFPSASSSAFTSWALSPVPGGQVFRHRLLLEIAGLFPGAVARLQRRARAHAGHRHRRAAGQPHPDGHRRHRRRRHRLHRHRPVHAPGAAQYAADLHHRKQRRLRADQGPVLGHRRPRLQAQDGRSQRPAAVRLLRAGHEMGRHLRGPLLQRRQEAAAGDSEGRHRAPGASP